MITSEDPQARAQDVKRCQLRPGKDRKFAAKIVCNTCQVNLCKDCAGHHITWNPTIRHDVITFECKKSEIIPLDCKRHKKQKCERFCEQCDTPVCLKCLVSGSHENHQVPQISEIQSSRQKLIKRDTHELESNIAPVFQSILFELEEMSSSIIQNHGERQKMFREFGNKCHTLVDIVINKYLSESKKIETEDKDLVQILNSEFVKLQSSVQSTIYENRYILVSNYLSNFTSYASRNETFRIIPSRFKLTVPPFDPTKLTEELLCQFIGDIPTTLKTIIPGHVLPIVQNLKSIGYEPKKKLLEKSKLVIAFHVGFDKTYGVHCTSNTDEFYGRDNSEIIKRINSEGTLLEEIPTKTSTNRSDGHQRGTSSVH